MAFQRAPSSDGIVNEAGKAPFLPLDLHFHPASFPTFGEFQCTLFREVAADAIGGALGC